MIDAGVLNAAIDLIMWIIVVLAMLLLYKSVPASKISEGIEIAKRGAAKTETPIDDHLVKLVEQVLATYLEKRGDDAGSIIKAKPDEELRAYHPDGAKADKDGIPL